MRRRAFVLVAVLVVVGASLLVATGLLFIIQGRAADAAAASDSAQTRALAWSGLQLVMAELDDQREKILVGERPLLARQYTVYETAHQTGVIRLLPMSADGASLLSAEAGKVDLNAVDAERLARLGGSFMSASAANAVVAYRDQGSGRPFQSVAELLHVPGGAVTAESLYGPIDQIRPQDQAQLERGDLAERVLSRLEHEHVRGLADLVTVFSVEPNIQQSGKPRLNLNQPWSDALQAQLTDQFGQRAAEQFKGMLDRGATFEDESKIVAMLRGADVPVRDWPQAFDALTATPGEFCYGRLDINTAPLEALLTLPDITSEQAAQIVSRRDTLAPPERSTIAWPVIARIIEPEIFERLAGQMTTRCFMYRVRLAAGEIALDDEDGALHNPMIWEAVIDLAGPRPRVAYLRDISLLQTAAQIALESSMALGSQSERLSADDGPTESPLDELETAAPVPDPAAPATGANTSESPAGQPATRPGRRIGRWLSGDI